MAEWISRCGARPISGYNLLLDGNTLQPPDKPSLLVQLVSLNEK